MNIYFTAEELLKAYDLLLKSGDSSIDSIVAKLRSPILSALEKEQEKLEKTMFNAWTSQEAKKIEELAKQNQSVVSNISKKSQVTQSQRNGKGSEKVSTA